MVTTSDPIGSRFRTIRRTFLSLATLAAALIAGSPHAGALETDPRPNIIFIFGDDWGYGDLSCYGNKEFSTPNLDKLAAEGTRYTQFHDTGCVCSPSRCSVITGHFPARERMHGHLADNKANAERDMPNWLDVNLPVYLPRTMHEAGYATAHFGKWHLGGGGEPYGDLTAPEPAAYGYDEARVWNGNGPTWKGDQLWPTTRLMDTDVLWAQSSSRIAVDATIGFIRKHKKEKPIFVNLWLKDPHTPLHPSEEQMAAFADKDLIPDKKTYFSVLTDADRHIGRLLVALSEEGIAENTLVIFSSDNGPAGYAPAKLAGSTGGLRGCKGNLFQGGINVPLIMRWPGHIKAGVVDETSVLSGVDLLPTFSQLAKKELPKDYLLDGESFASVLENQPFKRTKPLFWEWRPASKSRAKDDSSWASLAVRDGDWKLLGNPSISRFELYNIKEDRFEKTDLAAQEPQRVTDLRKKWDDWKATLPK